MRGWGLFLLAVGVSVAALAAEKTGEENSILKAVQAGEHDANQEGAQSTQGSTGNGPARAPRKVASQGECKVGEDCILEDGTTFRIEQGKTPRLDFLSQQFKKLQKAGVTDPEMLERMKAFDEKLKTVDPADLQRISELEKEFNNMRELEERMTKVESKMDALDAEHRPFRIGPSVTYGIYRGLGIGIEWEPPRISERLNLVFAGDVGAGQFATLPSDQQVRATYNTSASLNLRLGPGKFFGGGLVAGASDPFNRTLVGFGPMAGYRWERESFTLGFVFSMPYSKLAWVPEAHWMYNLGLSYMFRFGGGSKSATGVALGNE